MPVIALDTSGEPTTDPKRLIWEIGVNDVLKDQEYEDRQAGIDGDCFSFLVPYLEKGMHSQAQLDLWGRAFPRWGVTRTEYSPRLTLQNSQDWTFIVSGKRRV